MKFILTVPREMHLGYIKDTFGRGAVIELDEDRGVIIVDGRKFDDTRDLEILQRQALKNPDRPWIMPWSQELYDTIKGNIAPPMEPSKKPKSAEDLPIVQDDSTDHGVIDIRHTQISKVHAAEKEAGRTAAHNREVGRKMEVIQGDETAEERIARLKGQGDMRSMAERVAAKRERAHMPIIHDDSLGMGVGRNEIPMNAGQHLPSRAEAEAKTADRAAEAELRKQHAKMARKRAGIEEPDENISFPIDQDIPPELAEAIEVVGGTDAQEIIAATGSAVSGATVSDADMEALEADFEAEAENASAEEAAPSASEAENVALRAENAELKGGMAAVLARLERLEKAPAPKRKPAARKKTAKKVTRTPVAKD